MSSLTSVLRIVHNCMVNIVFSCVVANKKNKKKEVLEGNDLGSQAFALFLDPHPGAFRQLTCPHPREFAHFFQKQMLMPGGWPGGRGGHGHCCN